MQHLIAVENDYHWMHPLFIVVSLLCDQSNQKLIPVFNTFIAYKVEYTFGLHFDFFTFDFFPTWTLTLVSLLVI